MDHRFLRACRREPVDRTPVWFMRQAGRYLPEYRALRERHSLRDVYRTADLVVEATLQPIRRFEVDAALLFSHIALPLEPMGLTLSWADDAAASGGPMPATPIQSCADVQRLHTFDARLELSPILDAIGALRTELQGHRPVLALAGAPFSLACHAIDGGSQTGFVATKSMMYAEPAVWHQLCDKLTTVVCDLVTAQVEAGAEAIAIFDSWVGALGSADYREYVLPYSRRLFTTIQKLRVPATHFALGSGHLLEDLSEAGGDVIGIDWRIPLDEAWDRVGSARGIGGNLDPALLLGPVDRMLTAASDILERAGGRPGHVFNVGHGLLPTTPVERVQTLTRYVHTHSAAGGGR